MMIVQSRTGELMYFLLNDAVIELDDEHMPNRLIEHRFSAINFEFVQSLGREIYAEAPLLHRTDPDRAAKLCALILAKAPEINAALFVAPSAGCDPGQVGVHFACVDVPVMASLQSSQSAGELTPLIADRQVWRRMAA